jgi:hypothetical protein
MDQIRPDQPQALRGYLALQWSDLFAHLLWEIHRYEAPDSRHLSTLPMLAEVTDFL